jgi:tRNA pseudouridine55 synthase
MDGLLVLDKPAGPTSHDVVARMRRALDETRIGHTGTLDPAATGVLLLVLGRATRLARFLSTSDKSYEAVVRLGFATDTADAQGRATGPVSHAVLPSRETIDAALDAFRGTFRQQPPAFSAKKIDGRRSHHLARARARADADAAARLKPSRDEPDADARLTPSRSEETRDAPALPAPPAPPALPAPVSVTTYRLEIVSIEADTVTLAVDCSAGFYVRSLAHDLGERLGVGAHLATLRRVRTAGFTVDRAIDLETAERDPRRAAAAIIPLADMLPHLSAVTLTPQGVRRAAHGCELGPADAQTGFVTTGSALVRLLDIEGELVGIAQPGAMRGFLHPSIVLM